MLLQYLHPVRTKRCRSLAQYDQAALQRAGHSVVAPVRQNDRQGIFISNPLDRRNRVGAHVT